MGGKTTIETSALAEPAKMVAEALSMARVTAWDYDFSQDVFTVDNEFSSVYQVEIDAINGYKISSEDFISRFVHPDDAAIIPRAIRESNETNDLSFRGIAEYRVCFASGGLGYLEAHWRIIRDNAGRAILARGVSQDITDRKLKEQRIAESREQFRVLIEQQLAGISVILEDGSVAFVNQRLAFLLGNEPEEIVGLHYSAFIGDADKELVSHRISEGFRGISTGPIEFRLIRAEGAPHEVVGQASLATWYGRPAMLAVMLDNSERLRTRRAMQQTIDALADTLGLRDPYTEGHARRVSDLACAIAKSIGMSSAQIEGLRLAARVHDIGKIVVPAEILHKSGRLSEVEVTLIRGHVRAGYDILKKIDFSWPIAEIVFQHHERLDGSGYPQRLKGDEILPEAKVLAVADVVEAMCENRPYREKIGQVAALAEIERGKGILYDTLAADACIRLFNEAGFRFNLDEGGTS
jgi:PAS domain S-box-containing protein/putative nucleotidyltransferase with HDIG domain